MDIALPAWIGALAGMAAAALLSVPVIRILERRLRAHSGPMTMEKRAAFEDKLSVMRRAVLGTAIAILAVAGYWIGEVVGGR